VGYGALLVGRQVFYFAKNYNFIHEYKKNDLKKSTLLATKASRNNKIG